MSLWKIVLKNVAQRKLSSILTAFSIALGVAVVIAILTIKRQSRDSFSQSAFGYELIVGPKGSGLQLVLTTVYHLDQLSGSIPYPLYRELQKDRRVRWVAPIAVGDQYEGFRIVGTSDAFFRDFEVQPGRKFEIDGRIFEFSEERLEKAVRGEPVESPFEAVIGSAVARRTGLAKGSTFSPAHGLGDPEYAEKHLEKWTVVGILKETGTPADRAIYINLESFFEIKDHKSGGTISAMIVKARAENAATDLQYNLNQRTDVIAVKPAQVVGDLFEMIGKVDLLLLAVSILVIVVAGVSILVSIYNSMSERKRSIAIMRALGARRTTVLAIILLEAVFLCLVGGLVGVVAGHGMTGIAAAVLRVEAGVVFSPWTFHFQELAVFAGLVVLGACVGIVPALKAYRTDIAEGLSPTT